MGAAALAILALVSVLLVPRHSAASEQHGLQTIGVRLGTDGAIRAVTTASVVQDEDGRVTEHREDLEPARAAALLPVRVQTAWWHDGTSGTDLADLDGRSGRFVVQVAVQDLTAEPTDLAFETDGARYQQQALVGVPLTVVASATVGPGDRVVQADDGSQDGGRVTDGVLVETAEGERSVQWAAFLAAPMLTPTADFTLVVESAAFRAPSFDLAVQPGLVTDPSVAALVDRAYGADGYAARQEGAAIGLVQRVGRSLSEALDFVDQVHEALGEDVAHLGERTYRNLGSSSEQVLDHLGRTVEDLDGVLTDARSGITQVGTDTHRGVQDLSRSVAEILGSPGLRPTMSETVVAGCSVTMPTLAEGEARTVSATVVQQATDAALPGLPGTAFALQRVTAVRVEATGVTLTGAATAVPYRVTALWAGGGEAGETELFTQDTSDGMETDLLRQLTGGAGLDGVSLSSCYAAQVIGIRVLAEQPEASCHVRAVVGVLDSGEAGFAIRMR